MTTKDKKENINNAKHKSKKINPIKQLIGTAKSKIQKRNSVMTSHNSSLVTSSNHNNHSDKPVSNGRTHNINNNNSEPSTDGVDSERTTPRRRRRKKKKWKSDQQIYSGNVSRTISEPNLAPSGASSVKGASSTLSISSNKSGASSTKSSRRLFRRRKNNSINPSSASSNPSPPSTTSNNSNTSGLLSHQTNNGGKAGRRKVSQENKDPVFFLDIKTQNKRLVTPRQRQEIYALNRVMTRLENEKFNQFCQEKGHRGDATTLNMAVPAPSGVEEDYDIFM